MLERLNQELKRRTHVVRIFPNAESCLRLVRALAVEMHENWLDAMRYLNMDHPKEHKKEALRAMAAQHHQPSLLLQNLTHTTVGGSNPSSGTNSPNYFYRLVGIRGKT
jgi:Transposase, Mutator family